MTQIRFAALEGDHINLAGDALDRLDNDLGGRLIRTGADAYNKARQV